MLKKIAKRVILLLCTITVVGVLSGCTETILSQNGPTAIFVAGKLDSDNTFFQICELAGEYIFQI